MQGLSLVSQAVVARSGHHRRAFRDRPAGTAVLSAGHRKGAPANRARKRLLRVDDVLRFQLGRILAGNGSAGACRCRRLSMAFRRLTARTGGSSRSRTRLSNEAAETVGSVFPGLERRSVWRRVALWGLGKENAGLADCVLKP